MSKKGICPQCGKGPKGIHYLHPKTGQNICRTCYQKLTGKSLSKKGICSLCGKGPRQISFLHPETRQHICCTCYQKLTGKSLSKKGICPQCGKGPKGIHYLHPETRQNICQPCYQKLKEFLQWFRNLTEFQADSREFEAACCWIVDTANSREPKRIEQLNMLIKLEPEKVKKVSKEIQRPAYLRANWVFEEFLKTEEGKKLRSLIEEI